MSAHIAPRVVVSVKTTEGGLWIVPHVRALRAMGATVLVVLPAGDGRLVHAVTQLMATDSGVELHRTSFDFSFRPGVRLVRGLLAHRRLLRRLRADAALYHLYATALATRFALWGSRTRRVHMVAGPLYLESTPIRWAERVLCRLDHHVIAGSAFTGRAYAALGMPAHRLSVVPYGVDLDHFAPEPGSLGAARSRLGLPSDAFVAVMVAFVYAPKSLVHSAEGIKGHRVALEAWSELRQDHDDIRLLLVGSGFDADGEDYRQRLIASLPTSLSELGILWLDSVDDVREAYRAADLSLSPSLSENHGAAVEAGAMGCPSVVSNAGGLPETVAPDSGWIVPAGDAGALAAAVRDAIQEHRVGTLAAKGERAREHIAAGFALDDCARLVARTVLTEVPS